MAYNQINLANSELLKKDAITHEMQETEGDVKTADAKTQNNNWFLESSGDPNFKQSVAPEYNNALKWKFFCKSER